MSKHTKHHNLHGEVGNFFSPQHEGLPKLRTPNWTRITPTNTPRRLFHVVSQIGLIKKFLMIKFEKSRIFGLLWVTQISVQQKTRFTQQMLVFHNLQLMGSIAI